MLPAPVARLVAAAPLLVVSGARRPSPIVAAAARAVVAARPASAPLLVGCAPGVDAAARAHLSAQVLRASAFGRGRGAFAARSAALVRTAAATPGAVLVALPSGPCPAGLVPAGTSSRAFSGHGSGTWGTAALAAGLGLRLVVALPAGTAPPAGWSLGPLTSGSGLVWHTSAPSSHRGQGMLFE